MERRHTAEQVSAWRRHGAVLIPDFFTSEEAAAVRADFELVFAQTAGAAEPMSRKDGRRPGNFSPAQFKDFEAVPFDCSPALNLIGVHPALIEFARDALGTDSVRLYQCQAWAKFTGVADYDQPFHCDFANHTLTAPSEDARLNAVTFMCYFNDVTEAHGPMHYVARSDSADIAGPEASLGSPQDQADLHARLAPLARSTAGSAGTIFAYEIDVYHRGTNMVAPFGRRYAVTACFKAANNESIGYHAWQFHHLKPWRRIFAHATPQQLACFGVHPPGHPFWTATTLQRAAARYPDWNLAPYREAMASPSIVTHG